MKLLLSAVRETAFVNSLDAFVPEVWAQESLMFLEANMVAANLIHRDFSPLVASFGDTVNTRLPAEFKAARKTDTDDVTVQNATATNVPVLLNQHLHTSFTIKDGEESKGFESLRDVYLAPAMLSIAQAIDEIILGEVYEFLLLSDGTINSVGALGTAASKASVIAVREKMNENKVPQTGRNLILSSSTEADLLAVDSFTEADKVGDSGSAQREASLGRQLGLQTFMSQNCPSVASGSTVVTGAVNLSAGYAAGTTTMTVDGFSAALTAGSWFTVAGDMVPQRVVSTVGGSTPTSITFYPGLGSAVANNAVITVYSPGAINLGAGYASGYAKEMVVNGFSVAPKVGQLITIGSAGAAVPTVYSEILGVTAPGTTKILLNRPLEAAVSNADAVCPGPAGAYNFAFHRNALALVSRPLAPPQAGTGALSYTAAYNGLAMRVTITYNGTQQGHLVTCDMLLGVKVLDRRLGCVLLA